MTGLLSFQRDLAAGGANNNGQPGRRSFSDAHLNQLPAIPEGATPAAALAASLQASMRTLAEKRHLEEPRPASPPAVERVLGGRRLGYLGAVQVALVEEQTEWCPNPALSPLGLPAQSSGPRKSA